MSLVHVEQLRDIAEVEFADIVVQAFIPDLNELRIIWPMAALWTCGSR